MLNIVYVAGGILKLLGLNYIKDLTPREQILYEFATNVKKQFSQYRKRVKTFKARIETANKFHEKFSTVLNEMTPVTRKFILMQIRNHKKSKYKYTFTLDDKLLALSLQKRGPKAYKFLSSLFILPSKETLRKLLNDIDLNVGIHTNNIKFLARKLKATNDSQQMYCVLMFDEMRLKQHIQYQRSKDLICGFADDGSNRSPQFANCAMVWMLQGIHGRRPWKQPVAFTLNKSTCAWTTICQYYKDIVKLCLEEGIHIIASVCDQGSTNITAMSHMIQMTRTEGFHRGQELKDDVIIINGHKIVVLYDPPHLLKAFRNNLIVKPLEFKLDDKVLRTANWSHIEEAFNIDKSFGDRRLMRKLTDQHIFMNNEKKKMRVKYAAQVFSRSFGNYVTLLSKNGVRSECGQKQMPREGVDTADLLIFMNNLFDSVNNRSISIADQNVVATWTEQILVLKTMKFTRVNPGQKEYPTVLKNWILTLENFKVLRKYLKDLGFDSFNPRNFSQDGLENSFGQIRQYGVRNTELDPLNFEYYYKAMHLNFISDTHSRNSNCERNETDIIIDLKYLIENKTVRIECDLRRNLIDVQDSMKSISPESIEEAKSIMKKIDKNLKCPCEYCAEIRITNSEFFKKFIIHITNFIYYHLCHISHLSNVGKELHHGCSLLISKYFKCSRYNDILAEFLRNYIELIINKYTKHIDNILKGRLKLDSNICNTDDPVEKAAIEAAAKRDKNNNTNEQNNQMQNKRQKRS